MGFLKKITRPISRFLDKIIPNELKPALPYLSAMAPFMLGPGIMGTGMMRRALMSGALNIGSQLAQEGSEGEFSGLSALLAGGTGAMTAPGVGEVVGPAGETAFAAKPSARQFFADKAQAMDPGWMRSGTEMLGTGAEYLTGAGETLRTDPFSMAGLKAAIVPISHGTADLAMADARLALRDFEEETDEDDPLYSDDGRRRAIRSAMEAAGHLEDTIVDALASLGLRQGGIVGLKKGGRVGLKDGTKKPKSKALKLRINPKIIAEWEADGGVDGPYKTPQEYYEAYYGDIDFAQGGRVGAMGGGIMHAKRGLVNAPGGYAGDKEEVDFGGITEAVTAVEKTPKKFLVDKLEVTVMPGQSEMMAIINAMMNDTDGVMPDDRKQEFYRLYLPQLRDNREISEREYNFLMEELFNKANGGRIGYFLGDLVSKSATAHPGSGPINTGGRGGLGGMLSNMIQNNPKLFSMLNRPQRTPILNAPVLSESIDFIDENRNGIDDREEEIVEENAAGGGMMGVLPKGKEADYRGGGVIPIGSRERADDVPARLSKNEFVMTADAVRAAGGGNINQGAKRMYNLMNNLEARV